MLSKLSSILFERVPLRMAFILLFPWESLKGLTNKSETQTDDLLIDLIIQVRDKNPEEMKRISKELSKSITKDQNALMQK